MTLNTVFFLTKVFPTPGTGISFSNFNGEQISLQRKEIASINLAYEGIWEDVRNNVMCVSDLQDADGKEFKVLSMGFFFF